MKASFISYNQWVNEAITPTVNKHMTHAEDLVILKGVEGLKWVINMFTDLYDILQGHTKKENVKLSIKFDGAPAVFVWSNFPGLNRSGVAVKGLFAKDRKIMFTNEDIDKFYEDKPELAIKLKYMLKFVPKLKIPKGQIWQGDFLFDETTLFEDKEYYSFHPNTIVYKINKNSEMGKKIGDAKIGVVWHTRYTGESLDKIQANYNVKIAELNQIPQVFMTDPYIPSFAGIVTFTEEESEYFKQFIEKIDKTSKTLIFNPEYQKILDNNEFVSLFTIFQNSLIKNNIRVDSPAVFIDKFKEFLINRFQKEINVKKSENSKAILVEKLSNFINLIENNKVVYNITSLILEITKVKHMFIEKLNNSLNKLKILKISYS